MSIINKSPIYIPAKVKVAIDGCHVMVERSLGKNEVSFDDSVIITNVGDKICILHKNENDKHSCRMNGTARSMINAMISGVISGYSKIFEINGVGFTALMKGQNILDLSLGYSHEIL
jgi:large subunit ribosomal protein L6